MQIILAITALMLAFGFVFWVAVMSWIMAGASADKSPWPFMISMIVFALACVAFAFIAGRIWP